MTILSIENLILSKKCAKSNKQLTILKAVSATFESGKVNAIMGPNGCGKSTLLNAIFGLFDSYTKISGRITLDGKDRDYYSWINCVSYLEQDGYLIPNQTVYSCFEFLINILNAKNKLQSSLTNYKNILNALQINSGILDKKVGDLSGGERHRINIALELIMNRKVVMLDEPTSDLDSYLATDFMLFLKEYAKANDAIVIVTIHQPSKCIYDTFDNFLFMREGRVIYNGKASEAENYLASLGIKKPNDSVFVEFIFNVFYRDSVRIDHNMRAPVKSLLDKIEHDSELIVNSTKIMNSGETLFLMKRINLRSSLVIMKKIASDHVSLHWLRLISNQLAFISLIIVLFAMKFGKIAYFYFVSNQPTSNKDLSQIIESHLNFPEDFLKNFYVLISNLRLETILSCLVLFFSFYGMIKNGRNAEFKKLIAKGFITKLELLVGYSIFLSLYSLLYTVSFTIATNFMIGYYLHIDTFGYLIGDIVKITIFCLLSSLSFILIEGLCEAVLKKSNHCSCLHLMIFYLCSSALGYSTTMSRFMLNSLCSSFVFADFIQKLSKRLIKLIVFLSTYLFPSTYFRFMLISYIYESDKLLPQMQKDIYQKSDISSSDLSTLCFSCFHSDFYLYRKKFISKFNIFEGYQYKDTCAFGIGFIVSLLLMGGFLYCVFSMNYRTRFNLLNKN